MKVSAVIASHWNSNDKPLVLQDCINSLVGTDEILSLVTSDKNHISFTEAWNKVASLATGDYLIFIGDNNTLFKGNLKDLCIENTVTTPNINGKSENFNGMVFCMPRNIYEQIGLYDMRFSNGSHWEDIDLWRRLIESNIMLQNVSSVEFYRPQGGKTIDNLHNHMERKLLNQSIYLDKWKDAKRF
jgi:GT2 family glycosyltransferase